MDERTCVVCWHPESLCECVAECGCCGKEVCGGIFLRIIKRKRGLPGWQVDAPEHRQIPEDIDWVRAIKSEAPRLSDKTVSWIIVEIQQVVRQGNR
jgi:hypothetical protein